MLTIDSHCDTPSQIIRLRNLRENNARGHVDFPKLRAGNVDASFFALFTPQSMAPDAATRYALEMLAGVHDQVAAAPEFAAMAASVQDILDNREKGLISILLGMENGLPIQHSLALLREFYRQGVRYLTLTHNGDNDIADSAAGEGRWGGLSPFGREVVAEMNRIGMMIDVAHCSDKTFYDVLEASQAPVVSTHSCCRALASHRRNMTDDMIRKMADKGGVIQINLYPVFLSDTFARTLADSGLEDPADEAEAAFIAHPDDAAARAAWYRMEDRLAELPRPGVDVIVDHIDHAVQVGGIEHVGIGSDFDGINVTPDGVENIAQIGRVFDALRRRGYTEEAVEKIAGKNFLRVFRDISK